MAPQLPLPQAHQFVVYGDACSGRPNTINSRTLAALNAMLSRRRTPDFVLFMGDEISGLSHSRAHMQSQWDHFLLHERQWPSADRLTFYHVPGNHTVFDAQSAELFRDNLRMPANGPAGDEGLSYWVRRGDLLLVVVNTLSQALGGEGRADVEWLRSVLHQHEEAACKIVAGHHPAFPVNGFTGAHQRHLVPDDAKRLWDVLMAAQVTAYFCSHILAFDVQIRGGIAQITTGGAGTPHLMPPDVEYAHAAHLTVGAQDLRCEVLDVDGAVREKFSWPPVVCERAWVAYPVGRCAPPISNALVFRFTGETPASAVAHVILESGRRREALPSLWIGIAGEHRTLYVTISAAEGRSPHWWIGPRLAQDAQFDVEVMLVPSMGPGGILWRMDAGPWSSFEGASPWGADRINWADGIYVGGASSMPTLRNLNVWGQELEDAG